MEFKTTHNLAFEAADSPYASDHKMFRVGTCNGQWGDTNDCYFILSVINDEPGNGHLNDLFEWFEHSCKRDNRNLLVLECMNPEFYRHLIAKRGFVPLDANGDNVIKVFNKKLYKRLKKYGNEIILARIVKMCLNKKCYETTARINQRKLLR